MSRSVSPGFLIALILALGIGAAITVAQLDRQARTNPAMAEFVPAGFGGFADEQRSKVALATDPVTAERYAKTVAMTRPVDGSHLSHLAIWAAEADQMELASRTLTEAAKRGWRDTFVQISVLGSAAAQKNIEVASQRLDALARTKAEPEILMRAMDIILTIPGAEASLAERLMASQYLQDVLVVYSRTRPDSGEALSTILGFMADVGSPLECERRADIVRSLARRGDPLTLDVWGGDCPTGNVDKLEFDFVEDRGDPFAWNFQGGAGLSAEPGNEPGSVTLMNRKLVEKVVAWRYLALAPGSHAIAVAKAEQSRASYADRSPANFKVSVVCVGDASRSERTLGTIVEPGVLPLVVPEGCVTQQLRVSLGRGRVEDLQLAFESIG